MSIPQSTSGCTEGLRPQIPTELAVPRTFGGPIVAEVQPLNPTSVTLEHILASMARFESRLDEIELDRRPVELVPPPQPEPEPPYGMPHTWKNDSWVPPALPTSATTVTTMAQQTPTSSGFPRQRDLQPHIQTSAPEPQQPWSAYTTNSNSTTFFPQYSNPNPKPSHTVFPTPIQSPYQQMDYNTYSGHTHLHQQPSSWDPPGRGAASGQLMLPRPSSCWDNPASRYNPGPA